MTTNIFEQQAKITKEHRSHLIGHSNKVIWLTGLSGSGKSTIAHAVEQELHKKGVLTYVLDGDNVRQGLCSNLGFSLEDRDENNRRVREAAKLLYESGVFVLVSLVSPHKSHRDHARRLIGHDFLEIYISCPLEECERRDVKGLYKKARDGAVKDFTGIHQDYEPPEHPELILDTSKMSISQCVTAVLHLVETKRR